MASKPMGPHGASTLWGFAVSAYRPLALPSATPCCQAVPLAPAPSQQANTLAGYGPAAEHIGGVSCTSRRITSSEGPSPSPCPAHLVSNQFTVVRQQKVPHNCYTHHHPTSMEMPPAPCTAHPMYPVCYSGSNGHRHFKGKANKALTHWAISAAVINTQRWIHSACPNCCLHPMGIWFSTLQPSHAPSTAHAACHHPPACCLLCLPCNSPSHLSHRHTPKVLPMDSTSAMPLQALPEACLLHHPPPPPTKPSKWCCLPACNAPLWVCTTCPLSAWQCSNATLQLDGHTVHLHHHHHTPHPP